MIKIYLDEVLESSQSSNIFFLAPSSHTMAQHPPAIENEYDDARRSHGHVHGGVPREASPSVGDVRGCAEACQKFVDDALGGGLGMSHIMIFRIGGV